MVIALSKSRRILTEHLPASLRSWFLVIWPFLALLSLFYSAFVRVKALLFQIGLLKSNHLSVPVISIGNLTTGGTGKTPCTELVARHLRQLGLRVTIVSRGYGSVSGNLNDESRVLEENLPDVPLLQGADRTAMGQIAIDEIETEVILLDDGMQHRTLARNLEIVLIDATDPFGGGWLLPAGLLREPKSALRRADAILITHSDLIDPTALDHLHKGLARIVPKAVIAHAVHEPKSWLDASQPGEDLSLTDRPPGPVAMVCGIGNPEGFVKTLERVGLKVTHQRRFQDHHEYNLADIKDLEEWAKNLPEGTWLATTQKDMVKLKVSGLGSRKMLALRIGIKLTTGRDRFLALVDRHGLGGAEIAKELPPATLRPELGLDSNNWDRKNPTSIPQTLTVTGDL